MGSYKCKLCYKEFDRLLMADSCEKSHQIIYVPMHISEIDRLIQFVFTGDRSLISKEFWKKLQKIKKANK